ncbi:hypothetical protein GCM10022245_04720 [Streptomyces mayteni]
MGDQAQMAMQSAALIALAAGGLVAVLVRSEGASYARTLLSALFSCIWVMGVTIEGLEAVFGSSL